MNFNLDAARSHFDRWDLTITVNGQTCRVREVTVDEFAQILASPPAPMSDDETALLANLVSEGKEHVAGWDRVTRDEVTTAISAYLKGYLEKKRERIATTVQAAIRVTPSM